MNQQEEGCVLWCDLASSSWLRSRVYSQRVFFSLLLGSMCERKTGDQKLGREVNVGSGLVGHIFVFLAQGGV